MEVQLSGIAVDFDVIPVPYVIIGGKEGGSRSRGASLVVEYAMGRLKAGLCREVVL